MTREELLVWWVAYHRQRAEFLRAHGLKDKPHLPNREERVARRVAGHEQQAARLEKKLIRYRRRCI